jgi:hypothetical protein
MGKKIGKYYLGDKPPIVLNLAQWLMVWAPQKIKFLLGGRGLGKSTALGYSQKEKAFKMPRSSLFLVGETYKQMLTVTLPSTIEGLRLLGYHKDVHYFVGRKAPAKWKWNEAYQAPLVYDHAIHWISGAVTKLISLDLKDSGRGLNTDGGDGDETALFDEKRFSDNVLSTNRGNLDRFSKCPLHHSVSLFTSMPRTSKGKWIFKYEELAKQFPNDYFFLRASAEHNRHNLGDDWFKERKRLMSEFEYNTEILNIEPGVIEGGFYAQLDENTHCYTAYNNGYLISLGHDYKQAQDAGCKADGDLRMDLPIDVAFDYGANINTIHAEQEYDGVSHGLKSMHVTTPNTLDKLVNDFCDYYSAKSNKDVIYRYDHTAVFRDAVRTTTYAEVVIATFEARGWNVIPIYHGQAAGHHARKLFWEIFLMEKDARLPLFRLNKHNCQHMITSMQNAGVKVGRNGFEKDKADEKNATILQHTTTHYSDAADTLYYFKYGQRLNDSGGEYSLPS